jgi:hypothetical protein
LDGRFCSKAAAPFSKNSSASGEDRGLQAQFITEVRDGIFLQQMPPEEGDFLFRRLAVPLLLDASPLPYWENAFRISS